MNQKHVEGFIGSMCGLGGYGFLQINVHIPDSVLKFIISMLTAILAGGLGWLGQQVAKKIYKIFKSKTTKDADN